MGELVFLRDHLRNNGTRGKPEDIARVFKKVRFDTLFECIIMRAAYPYPPAGVILSLDILGLRSVTGCANAAPEVRAFAFWYTTRLNLLLHLDVHPVEFGTFRDSLNRVFMLAQDTERSAQTPVRNLVIDSVTRPTSASFRDRCARNVASFRTTKPKRGEKQSSAKTLSPRAVRTINASPTSSGSSNYQGQSHLTIDGTMFKIPPTELADADSVFPREPYP